MSSILPGFEFDVFVSYRQKDNKGEHWVTEFVNALKTELEAAFKEDVSIYFDENAHDGLLSTHDVDESLKNKLRCLIFIPIISQTYCDPKSFAWNSEFLVFKHLASEDSHGLKIKLKNGNVASRILPVRIHELDTTDKRILENEIGPLRSVDFIFNAPGVNRALKKADDMRGDNSNKIFYHDQVNKVANGIKEIIDGIRFPDDRLGRPGGTQTVFHDARKKTGLTRGMVASLFGLALIVAGSFYFLIVRKNGNPSIGKSIAVLPFVDLSPGHDQEYLSEGLSEEIRNTLSRIKDLKVAGRTSSLVFKGAKADLKEVGKRLNVSTALEGSVQKIGNTIRISIQLSNTEDGYTIWGESSNRELNEILKVETVVAGNVATQIVEALNLKLSPQERRGLTKRYTENIQAYELYRKGWLFWDKRDSASIDSAESHYKRALTIDPDYALAYAGMGDCAFFSGDRSTGLTYLTKALSLDSTLAEALATMGLIYSLIDYDWAKSKRTLQRSIAFDPNYPFGHLYYGNLLQYIDGDTEQGLKELKKAVELDPLSPWVNWVLGRNYFVAGQYDLAGSQLIKTLALDSNFQFAKGTLGLVLLQQQKYTEAIKLISTIREHLPEPDRRLELSYAYAVSGDKSRARIELKRSLAENSKRSHYQIARVYVAIGDFDEAIAELEKAVEARDPIIWMVRVEPLLQPLKNEPRFKALMKKMNLE